MHILVVEDDVHVADALDAGLRQQGHRVSVARTGGEALGRFADCDFVLLDIGLPDLDGVEWCRRVRAESAVPIIMVSARTEEIDRVMGLHAGADDYIVKPYTVHELNARIQAVARRSCRCGLGPHTDDGCRPPGTGVLVAGPLRLDPRSREAELAGRRLDLTRKEFDLLALLAAAPDTVHTRTEVISRVWDENWYGSTRTLDVHIGCLRRKLGGYDWIETTRGVGFRLTPPAGT